MTRKDNMTDQSLQLRLRAEKAAQLKNSGSEFNLAELSSDDAKKVVHELLVHQIELEMQNEEMRRVQGELESSNARYFDLYNNAPVGYLSMNEDGMILEGNLTAASLLGLTNQEMQTRLISCCIVPEDQDIFYHHRHRLFASRQPQVCELRMKRSGKSAEEKIFWARIESTIVTQKVPYTCRTIISDITEKILIAEQFHQAQKMESIGLLAGGIAHDYNNKLAIIIGYSELALNNEVSSQTVKVFLEEILKAAQFSATITRQLLTYARKQAIMPVIVDLNSIIGGMISMLRHTIGEDIELIWKPGPGLYPVKVDPVQIDQVLVNLCINAREAIDGIGRLTIETHNTSCDGIFCSANPGYLKGDFVMIEVADTGCGMTSEILARIFEPFFTTRKVGQGTGLGLASVEGIVKQNNGFIKVVSEPGKGTTFRVHLPRFEGAVVGRMYEQNDKMLPGCGETVLIVEDESSLLAMIKVMLEKLGYRVLAADSPLAAVKLAESLDEDLHILLTDVIMPEMNGCLLAEILRKLNPDMKTMFMSGYSANILALKGEIEGNVNFIQKPFSLKELAEKIGRIALAGNSPMCSNLPQ